MQFARLVTSAFAERPSIDPPDPCIVAMFETRRVQYRELMQTLRELLPVHSSDIILTHNIDLCTRARSWELSRRLRKKYLREIYRPYLSSISNVIQSSIITIKL